MKPEEHAYRHSTKNDRKLSSICDPLKTFGIDHLRWLAWTGQDLGKLMLLFTLFLSPFYYC